MTEDDLKNAAPEMYQVLKQIHDMFHKGEIVSMNVRDPYQLRALAELLANVHIVLAKAEGKLCQQ